MLKKLKSKLSKKGKSEGTKGGHSWNTTASGSKVVANSSSVSNRDGTEASSSSSAPPILNQLIANALVANSSPAERDIYSKYDIDHDKIAKESVDYVMNMLGSHGLFNVKPKDIVKEVNLKGLPPYSYTPLLSASSIRLLEFTNSDVEFPNFEGSQKFCRLVTYSLKRAPRYICLSYTWGAPVLRDDLKELYDTPCDWVLGPDGEPTTSDSGWTKIAIGQNLYRAMTQMLKTKHSISHIWIDALCINQDDLAERAAQVAIMTEIYSQCERTIVWLGDGAYDRDLAKFYILHQDAVPPLGAYLKEHRVEISEGGWDMKKFYEITGLNPRQCDWKYYAKFYREREVFKRSWILQELCFSKDLIVMVAHHAFSLQSLAALAGFLRFTDLSLDMFEDEEDGVITTNSHLQSVEERGSDSVYQIPGVAIFSIQSIKQRIDGIGTMDWLKKLASELDVENLETAAYVFFLRILVQIRSNKATDPRDKIFAAFGFLKKMLEPLEVVPLIQPDYEKSVKNVYIDTTVILLQMTPDFCILSECEPPRVTKVEGLPSWVPDYSMDHLSLFSTDRHSRYNVTGVSSPRVVPDQELYTMHTSLESPTLILNSCYFLDDVTVTPVEARAEIASGTSVTATTLWNDHTIKQWRRLLAELRPTPGAPKNTYSDWKILFTTILADRLDQVGHKALSATNFKSYITNFLVSLDKLLFAAAVAENGDAGVSIAYQMWNNLTKQWYEDAERYPNLIPSEEEMTRVSDLRHKDATSLNTDPEYEAWERHNTNESVAFAGAMGRNLARRRLFTTSGGRLGLGPDGLKARDRILVAKGARMLYAVREVYQSPDSLGVKQYRLLGECYVHGVMNGELLKKPHLSGYFPVALI
jgi:hypothetical protein